MRKEGSTERVASKERGVEEERTAKVVPAKDHRIQQHRYHQLQLVLERRHGAVRAAALVRGRRARALRHAGAARQAHQLRGGLRRRRDRGHTHHTEYPRHDPTGASRLAAGDGLRHERVQAF